jgi:hypothetical protein
MGATRLSPLLVLIIALSGGVLYAQPAPRAAAGGGASVGARPQTMARPGARVGAVVQTPGHGVNLPPTGLPPTGSIVPGATPVPVQPIFPPAPPFGSTTVFVGNGFMSFPVVPITPNGFTMPLSAIGFAAGADLVPPVVIGGGFLTNTFLFQTPFGPAIAQPQQAPFVTVGSNILNVGAQAPFFSPFFPVPTPFGFPGAPNPFLPGFAPFVVQ